MSKVFYIYTDTGSSRSMTIARALAYSLHHHGWVAYQQKSVSKKADLFAGYGYGPEMRDIFKSCPESTLQIDLGFWARKPTGEVLQGYHKMVLGSRFPILNSTFKPSVLARRSRLSRLPEQIKALPSRPPGRRILVCGMSSKAAGTFGLAATEWEGKAIRRLNAAGATVLYRPKPSWPGAAPLSGAEYHSPSLPLEDALAQVDGVATHHGNTAIDALAYGLPVYVETGTLKQPAERWAVAELEQLPGASPPSIEQRQFLLEELAWHQWSVPEIGSGLWLQYPAPLSVHPLFAK